MKILPLGADLFSRHDAADSRFSQFLTNHLNSTKNVAFLKLQSSYHAHY